METTNELKIVVMAPYINKRVRVEDFMNPSKNAEYTVLDGFTLQSMQDFNLKSYCLVLKPLSAISEEDATQLAKILKPNDEYTHNHDYGKTYARQLFSGVMHTVVKCFAVYQFLQSRGYDLPNHLLGGLTLKEAGLAVYE